MEGLRFYPPCELTSNPATFSWQETRDNSGETGISLPVAQQAANPLLTPVLYTPQVPWGPRGEAQVDAAHAAVLPHS